MKIRQIKRNSKRKNLFRFLFDDKTTARLIKNSSILLSGNVIADIISIASVILAARSLGSKQFGTVCELRMKMMEGI